MFTLLAEQQKKKLFRQYRLRLLSLIAFFLSLLLLVAAVLLLPSRIMLGIEKGALQSEKDEFEKSVSTENSKDLISTLDDIKSRVTLAEPTDTRLFTSLQTVLAKRPAGVSVTSIDYTRGEGAPSSLSLRGIANERTKLIEFYKVLQKESGFSEIFLPVESLAKETKVPFTIGIKGKF